MTVPLAETPTVGLGQFIKEAKFSVPSHQRDYSWKQEYIEQFINDITRSLKEQESIYFCGLMVFVDDDSSFKVLDGQQRLATTIILFSAIRNWLGKYSEFSQFRDQIDTSYLGETEFGETAMRPKLILNRANNDVFRNLVINTVPISDVKKRLKQCKKEDRNRALLEALVYVHNRVEALASQFQDFHAAKDYFVSLVRFIVSTVRVVRLIVKGEDAAYTIFEILNDRGMDLAPLDLVKNYLFSKVEKTAAYHLEDMEERWTEMMTVLSSKKADSFLRAFWSSRHGVPDGARLFAPFKRMYSTPEAVYQVSVSMREVAEHYVALTDADDPIWSAHTGRNKESIQGISIVGSTQFYPLILAALSTPDAFNQREMERLLRLVEVLAVRHSLIGKQRPGRIESLSAITAKQITEGTVTSATQVFEKLRELYTTDDQFRTSFLSADAFESKKTNYLFRRMERQARLAKSDVHWREVAPDAVTVEHILPKSPGEGWSECLIEFPDFVKDFVGKLGNLCLLADANRLLGNKSFEEKKALYATSNLELTSSIVGYNAWTPEAVSNRQARLASLAVAEWRFD